MASDQENEEKLQYAARLSGLLLNEGTDVMRWFLMDNLPRIRGSKPNLTKQLKENEATFEKLLNSEQGEQLLFGQEMYDMLFPPKGLDVDQSNMEISLMIILIRYLCKLKHSSWRWWEEEPQPHQRLPLFDVIRLARFKDRMKNIVHNYEITKETYEQSLKYLVDLIERLKGHKSSVRRWEGNNIAYKEDEHVTKERKAVDLVTIMRWQTLPVKQRNNTYLVLKKNFCNLGKLDSEDWRNFLSCFGQMKNLAICHANEPNANLDQKRFVVTNASDISPAKALNWCMVYDSAWKKKMREGSESTAFIDFSRNKIVAKSAEVPPILMTMEKQIYSSVTDRIFITDTTSESPVLRTMREGWKEAAIDRYSKISVFPFKKEDVIEMDEVKTNISTANGVSLPNWADAIPTVDEPLRVVIRGPPCCGKTTLLRKIAYDCATMNCPQLQQYDLVFIVDLSKMILEKPYTRIVDCIRRHCFIQDLNISSDDLETIIADRNGHRVLFLFDEVDNFSICDETSEFCDIIKSQLWSDCGIIVAKRSTPYYMEHNVAEALLQESRIAWETYTADGFRFHDVYQEVHRRLAMRPEVDSNAVARHFLNLMRVYQRDIYKGRNAAPILTSMFCKIWKDAINNVKPSLDVDYLQRHRCKQSRVASASLKALPETLGQVIGDLLSSYFDDHASEVGEFEQEILLLTMKNEVMKFDSSKSSDKLQKLTKLGIVSGSTFTHPLLQDFFAAKLYCLKTTFDCPLKKYLRVGKDALSLQSFLSFCCELDSTIAEEILELLGDITKKEKKFPAQMLQLSLRCFYASSLDRRSKGHWRIASSMENVMSMTNSRQGYFFDSDLADSDLITAELFLPRPHKLSSKTRQSILKFTTCCQPPLTSSGTVFPLLHPLDEPPSTSYISSLHISGIRESQVVFISEIISRLPFLRSVALTDIESISATNFKKICYSIRPEIGITSCLHSITVSFKTDTKFDFVGVPTYDSVGEILHKLPFLETLQVTPLSYKHFMSIYDNCKTIVPLENVQLSRCNINEDQCSDIVRQLQRTNFVINLDLSHNPIHNGLMESCQAFEKFSVLKTVNLEQCCLAAPSITVLSSCFNAPKLSHTVTSVNLRGNHVDDQPALLAFVKSLGHLNALQSLDLSQNFLRDRVICVLSIQLCKMKRLRHLLLDYVQMGEIGLSSVLTHISGLEEIEVLSFAENPLHDDAIRLLSDLGQTKTAHSLTELKISGISSALPLRVTSDGVKKATRALDSFKKIRILDLSSTSMGYSDCVRIIEAAETHATIEEVRLNGELLPLKLDERANWRCLSTT